MIRPQDGQGTNGALTLLITYLDDEFNLQNAFHTLGNTGSDETTFSGLGINRGLVFQSGSDNKNNAEILINDTTNGNLQRPIPAAASVTQAALYHVPIGFTPIIKTINLNSGRTTGGQSPIIEFKMIVYSRVTDTFYDLVDEVLDVDAQNNIDLNGVNLILSGRDVFYFTATTDRPTTNVAVRAIGNYYKTA